MLFFVNMNLIITLTDDSATDHYEIAVVEQWNLHNKMSLTTTVLYCGMKECLCLE